MMHYSVLLQESIEGMAIKPDGVYVDGTFGRGGHSREILSGLSEQGRLLAFDKDLAAHKHAQEVFAQESRLTMCHDSFANMRAVIEREGLLGQVDGILLDLGVSSPQLDEAGRGFSFLHDGPLDMRMDQQQALSAKTFLAEAEVGDIARVLDRYGEEKFARLIASRIVERRASKPFETTKDLADFIEAVIPKRAQKKNKGEKQKHPATRSFQGLRIHVNNELGDVEQVLQDVVEILAPGGRLVVISFHSLEDRIVKRFIKAQEKGPDIPRHIPIQAIHRDEHLVSVGKAIKAGKGELDENVRSRSAVLRVAEKIPPREEMLGGGRK